MFKYPFLMIMELSVNKKSHSVSLCNVFTENIVITVINMTNSIDPFCRA